MTVSNYSNSSLTNSHNLMFSKSSKMPNKIMPSESLNSVNFFPTMQYKSTKISPPSITILLTPGSIVI